MIFSDLEPTESLVDRLNFREISWFIYVAFNPWGSRNSLDVIKLNIHALDAYFLLQNCPTSYRFRNDAGMLSWLWHVYRDNGW